ncbi:MAG: LacI family DNA-binding transcriptional regulator [Bacteroidetes bacterium]|nr:MAG: LacI family DNA-binding transcriptional regulator [Bacteroidota bacterium]
MTKVTILDIAEHTGVSAGTVDRVIHNRGEVSLKTREKVLQAIKKLNYEPDILARSLASRKTLRFAALLPEGSNPFWIKPAEGLNAAWREIKPFGIAFEEYRFPYYHKTKFYRQLNAITESKPDGVVIAPVFTDLLQEPLQKLEDSGIPYVFMNTQWENSNYLSFVGQDSMQSGRVAARLLDYCIPEGGQILIFNFISSKGVNSHLQSREQGFMDYFMSEPGAGKKKILTINANTQINKDIEDLLSYHLGLISNPDEITGIFVTNSRVFHIANALEKIKQANIRLVGYDLLDENIRHLRNSRIDFLIGQKPFEQGYKSIITLFNAIVRKKEVPENQFLPIDIITKENIDFYLNL